MEESGSCGQIDWANHGMDEFAGMELGMGIAVRWRLKDILKLGCTS